MNSPVNLGQKPQNIGTGARASVVNRTHRIVREQAIVMRENRSRTRSLWLPIGIFSVLLPIICYAVWYLMDGYDLTPTGIPDASDQLFLLMLWSLPLTIVLLGIAWYKRERNSDNGEARQ
jgi:hypothetical protein